MALLLPNSCFVHVPKTGGTSVRAAIREAGLAQGETGNSRRTPRFEHRVHMLPTEARRWTDKPMFAFTRDKVDWYVSIYMHRLAHGRWPVWDASDKAMLFQGFDPKNDFNYWAWWFVTTNPGWLTNLYEFYTRGIVCVGRTEFLEADLQRILWQLEGVWLEKPVQWENVDSGEKPELAPGVAELIREKG